MFGECREHRRANQRETFVACDQILGFIETADRCLRFLHCIQAPGIGVSGTWRLGARDQLRERVRILRFQSRQILADLHLELAPADGLSDGIALSQQIVGIVDRIDDRRAKGLQRRNRRLHHIVRLDALLEEITRDADACTLERTALQILRIVRIELASALLRGRIRSIDARHDAERDRDVIHAARHGSRRVVTQRQRHDAIATQQAVRRLEASDTVHRRRSSHRTSCVGPQSELREVGRDCSARTATRSRRALGQIVGILGLPAHRAETIRTTGPGSELAQVHFGQNDRAGLTQLLHDECVVGWNRALEDQRTRRGRHVERIEVVFEHDGNAVNRRARPFALALFVECARLIERLGVQCDDRVDRRSLLVEGLDALQVHPREFLGGEGAGIEGIVDVGDRRRIEIDGRGLRLCCERCKRDDHKARPGAIRC